MKISRQWTGKKEPTDPTKKEAHKDRKTIKEILFQIEKEDWEQQLKDYINEKDTI